MRSRTGCLTCRTRKLKCDERKPECGQCARSKRRCRPSEGVVWRHQQNASMNTDAVDTQIQTQSHLPRFFAYKDTFGKDGVWVDVPRKVTFVNVEDPYAEEEGDGSVEPEPTISEGGSRDRQEVYSATETARAHGSGRDGQSTNSLYAPTMMHESTRCPDGGDGTTDTNLLDDGGMFPFGSLSQTEDPSTMSLDPTLNPTSSFASIMDSELGNFENGGSLSGISQGSRATQLSHPKASTETDQTTAFFLRHFSEVTGSWMDLFDQTTFFSSHIPVKAISSPLLKNAACAYAAKQLARVHGRKASPGPYSLQQVRMQTWERAGEEDWALTAAQYYDKAISLLMEALQWDHISSVDNSSEDIDKRHYAPRTVEGMVEERKLRRRQFGSAQSTASSDDLLAATAILCEYESLDASNAAWAHHLSGTKSLLDVVEVGMVPLDGPERPLIRRKLSQARKATFWNFARQDLFAAYVHECRTRLDTEDIALWKDAGLILDEDGLIVPSNTLDSNVSGGEVMREDMIGNALIWLVSKLMNLLCLDESSQDINDQQILSAKWTRLTHEMENWFNGLPETFMPSAILPTHPHGTTLTEVWSSIPVCSATIMTWHMAQILMLIHRPPNLLPTTPSATANRSNHHHRPTFSDKVRSYRTLGQEISYHSREILGICLGGPEDGVRIHALQPLYVAGQCLTGEGERRVVLDLLRGVERETGWCTEYRVRGLKGEWGWDGDEEEEE